MPTLHPANPFRRFRSNQRLVDRTADTDHAGYTSFPVTPFLVGVSTARVIVLPRFSCQMQLPGLADFGIRPGLAVLSSQHAVGLFVTDDGLGVGVPADAAAEFHREHAQ